jgi:hypothetical protein
MMPLCLRLQTVRAILVCLLTRQGASWIVIGAIRVGRLRLRFLPKRCRPGKGMDDRKQFHDAGVLGLAPGLKDRLLIGKLSGHSVGHMPTIRPENSTIVWGCGLTVWLKSFISW